MARVGICNPDPNVMSKVQSFPRTKRSGRDYKSRPAKATIQTPCLNVMQIKCLPKDRLAQEDENAVYAPKPTYGPRLDIVRDVRIIPPMRTVIETREYERP